MAARDSGYSGERLLSGSLTGRCRPIPVSRTSPEAAVQNLSAVVRLLVDDGPSIRSELPLRPVSAFVIRDYEAALCQPLYDLLNQIWSN
jgi:hypothetical protein